MVKLSLRMNLADILENEKVIMEKLNEIHKNSVHFFLKLWYEEERLKLEQIKEFVMKNENKLHFKTSIKPDRSLGANDFIWFDIINTKYDESVAPWGFLQEMLNGKVQFHPYVAMDLLQKIILCLT